MNGAWWTPPGQSADMSGVLGQGAGMPANTGNTTPMGGGDLRAQAAAHGDWQSSAPPGSPGGGWSWDGRNSPMGRGPDMSGVLGMGADGPIAAHANAGMGMGMENSPWRSRAPAGDWAYSGWPVASPSEAPMSAHAQRMGLFGR
jgi:hypothetical protein